MDGGPIDPPDDDHGGECLDCDGTGSRCDQCGDSYEECSCWPKRAVIFRECDTCEGTGEQLPPTNPKEHLT